MHAGLDEEGEMGIRTQAPIGHEHIARWSARMDRLHLGEIVGWAECTVFRLTTPTPDGVDPEAA
jgi:hypothetical protein